MWGLGHCWPDADPDAGTQDGEGSRVRSTSHQPVETHISQLWRSESNPCPMGLNPGAEEATGSLPRLRGDSARDSLASRGISIHSPFLQHQGQSGASSGLSPPTTPPCVSVCLSSASILPSPSLTLTPQAPSSSYEDPSDDTESAWTVQPTPSISRQELNHT